MCRISVFKQPGAEAGVAVAGLRKSSESVKYHFDFVRRKHKVPRRELWHGAKSRCMTL